MFCQISSKDFITQNCLQSTIFKKFLGGKPPHPLACRILYGNMFSPSTPENAPPSLCQENIAQKRLFRGYPLGKVDGPQGWTGFILLNKVDLFNCFIDFEHNILLQTGTVTELFCLIDTEKEMRSFSLSSKDVCFSSFSSYE